MLRIRFTAEDLARTRFAPRPVPLQELHAALSTAVTRRGGPLFAPWRGRVLRALPAATEPLADLVPAGRAPAFLDVLGDTVDDGFAQLRATGPDIVRSELERVYGTAPAPPWIRGLHAGDETAWRVLHRAHRVAHETVLAPVWPVVQELHREEFTRYALAAAEHGVAAALTALAPGSRLHEGVWEWPGVAPARELDLEGRGLVLLPTFHHPAGPLLQDTPGRPAVLTYPAGPGLPPTATPPDDPAEALAAVLGRTRLDALRLLAEPHTTTSLARALRVSNATASAHAAALRSAGMATTTRTGRSVTHLRTALGALVAGDRTAWSGT
ncbi:helix-turn-helix domain-containing protein [Streptomyces sp. VRA16 Mangrove soil]|uniref:helix-turn-helix domain-containing protein n=1 Tax=Streptomyces sp. VRA16 Mangrove soil TaxID=2817434 RepID=UPI001A9F3E3B|nr:helix-turn-helix domain-containing protein [Streptomyces sp. VRA16 Mangrove soil]MBO1329919.1 helix-turn-helix domain-containing protein [Streptomyces sp. VRA16 Mangrove soil]